MQNNDKKVLLRISNLKQYFPLKGGRFVKANDGITLDIYCLLYTSPSPRDRG